MFTEFSMIIDLMRIFIQIELTVTTPQLRIFMEVN